MGLPCINTRADLDALQQTDPTGYTAFMAYLKGTMTRTVDTQTYPAGYGQPGYTGAALAPVWSQTQDLSIIERFGFTAADFATS